MLVVPTYGGGNSKGAVPKQARMQFVPPQGGPDWVLVLDDASCGFPPPGVAIQQ